MEIRKPFQGIKNVIRFNWHFYLFAFGFVLLLFVAYYCLFGIYANLSLWLALLICLSTIISLVMTLYVYDLSGLYKLNWLKIRETDHKVLSISAGFDEVSTLINAIYNIDDYRAVDFYDPDLHTEISIERARRAYPPYPGTIKISTDQLPFEDESMNLILLILAAHEIRKADELHSFFLELKRVLKNDGRIILVEHFRDLPNFLSYNLGAFHFQARSTWLKAIENSSLKLEKEYKLNPLMTKMTIVHGNAH